MNDNILDVLIKSVKEQNLHVLSVIIRKNGDIIAEHDFVEPKPTLLWSVSKTFTSMAVGIAESEGYFKLNDKIVNYFANDFTEANDSIEVNNLEINDNLKNNNINKNNINKITIHDLLCMGTGHARCPMGKVIRENGPFDNISKLFFEEPVIFEPGTHFVYNNAATYMLSKLISITTGFSLKEYLMPRIFKPLGIPEPYWEADVNGINFGCNGLYLTARELSKFGQLLLNKGIWKNKQLIPADYIAKAAKSQINTSEFNEFFATADHKQGYGYQIWLNSYPDSYRMDGMFGQYVVMLPDKNSVVTYVSNEPSNMTGILELTWNTIVDKL